MQFWGKNKKYGFYDVLFKNEIHIEKVVTMMMAPALNTD